MGCVCVLGVCVAVGVGVYVYCFYFLHSSLSQVCICLPPVTYKRKVSNIRKESNITISLGTGIQHSLFCAICIFEELELTTECWNPVVSGSCKQV